MSKHIDLNNAANMICDLLAQGVLNTIDNDDDTRKVNVHNPANGQMAIVAVKPAKPTAIDTLAPKPAPAVAKKKTAMWWSRFNFEKNVMKMALFALQDRFPDEPSFTQKMFAEKLASMMHWQLSTAKRHITQAAKMGILNRSVIGTVYHITGLNDENAETLQEEMADSQQPPEMMPLPGEDLPEEETHAPMSAIAHEGRILFEQEFEKAVDEAVLP